MAVIKPFHGLRYTQKAGAIETLVCPPYDIISDAQREAYLTQNPYNVIRLEAPQGTEPYAQARRDLQAMLQQELLRQDIDEGLYLYELGFRDQVETGEAKRLMGLICRVRLEDFASNVVLPHEETLSKAKEDRMSLMKATNCNISQIYALYQDENRITKARMENLAAGTTPRYVFDDGLVTHKLWVVNDPLSIAAICDDFVDRKLYIADGHHRYETALQYRDLCRAQHLYNPDSDDVMMFLADMADEGLVVFPTHRVVRDLADFDPAALLAASAAYFDIVPLQEATLSDALCKQQEAGKKAFVFYTEEAAHLLSLKDPSVMAEVIPGMSEDYRMLDVSILHSLVLEKLLHIDKENMANQKNLVYTRSVEEAKAMVQTGAANCAFFLNPTQVGEIGAVAANGEKMPQKSTYFYPKLTTGLVMNRMGEPQFE